MVLRIDEIAKGGAVEIELKYNGKTMSFKSEVAQVKNNSVLVTSIMVNEQTIGFSDKYLVNFLFKAEDKLYIWEKVTVKLVKFDGGVFHMIELLGDGKPYNRRDSFRLYIGEDMPLYVNAASGPTALSVLVKDISETGVAFIAKEEIDLNRTFRLKFNDSTNNTIIHLSGVVVRKEFLDHLGSYLYGSKFNEKNHKLGKFIIQKQAEAIKKRTEPLAVVKEKTTKNKKTEVIQRK